MVEGKPLLDPTREELKMADSELCVTFAGDINKVMHVSMKGGMSKAILHNVSSGFNSRYR